MAKSKKKDAGKKSQARGASDRNNVQKIARQAGKIAAQAERIARDAVDKAMQASTMVVDVIGHPSHAADALGTAVTAGRKTAAGLGTGAQHLLESGTGASSDAVSRLTQLVDERLRATVHSLGLATQSELETLRRRVAELEGGHRRALPAARRSAARKPAASKAAARKPAAAKPAAAKKPAARKPAVKKT